MCAALVLPWVEGSYFWLAPETTRFGAWLVAQWVRQYCYASDSLYSHFTI